MICIATFAYLPSRLKLKAAGKTSCTMVKWLAVGKSEGIILNHIQVRVKWAAFLWNVWIFGRNHHNAVDKKNPVLICWRYKREAQNGTKPSTVISINDVFAKLNRSHVFLQNEMLLDVSCMLHDSEPPGNTVLATSRAVPGWIGYPPEAMASLNMKYGILHTNIIT